MRTKSGICSGLAIALLFSLATATPSLGDPGFGEDVAAITSAQLSAIASATRAVDLLDTRGDWRVVERVVDGDTLVLAGGERVRLIGVDTPESVHPTKPVQHFAKEASAFTRALVQGEAVRLTFDWEPTDRYGRTLAYAHLQDGRVLNEVLIRRGYSRAYTRFRFVHSKRYRALEREARTAEVGLWQREEPEALSAALPVSSPVAFMITASGTCYHRATCRHARSSAARRSANLAGLRRCRVCKP